MVPIHFKRMCWKLKSFTGQYLTNVYEHFYFSFLIKKYSLLWIEQTSYQIKARVIPDYNQIIPITFTHSILYISIHTKTLFYSPSHRKDEKSLVLERWLLFFHKAWGSTASTHPWQFKSICNSRCSRETYALSGLWGHHTSTDIHEGKATIHIK